jgi:DNA-binding LytR/AlgR family response regulator
MSAILPKDCINSNFMRKIKVIIIEDEFFAAQHLSDVITNFGYWVVGVYHSGEEFLAETDWNFDAAVVDIFLSGELSGLGVGEKLKDRRKPFLFLTANQDERTLKDAARLTPTAYISKPFKNNDVSAALQIISHQLAPMLQLRGTHGVEEINPNDIIYIQSDGAYIEIQTLNTFIVQRKLLKDIIDELPNAFIRVHRSYLVNCNFIEQRTATHLIVRGGHEIPISRSYKENLDL